MTIMNEVFNLYTGSFPLAGVSPLLVVASSKTGANEVIATGIILSRFPNGEDRITKRAERLSGKPLQPLPDYEWTEVMANGVTEWVTNTWTDEVVGIKDPIWNEYLRVKGPLTWIQQDKPERGLLRYALHANEALLDKLSALAHNLPHPAAAKALKQAIEFRLKVRIHDD